MLRALMDRVDSIQEQIAIVSRDGNPKKNQRKMLEITTTMTTTTKKHTITEMKNAFNGLISRLERTEEKIPELEDMSIGTSQTEKQ